MIIGQMNKVFHFDAPRERYRCDAAILWCFDSRFELGLRKYLQRLGIVNMDPIKIAGGAKCLASPEQESDRQFVLEQIRKSINLHGTKRVVLKVHSDCGAYGGLEAFGNEPRREAEHHCLELHKAAACLRAAIPDLEILAFYVDFEGIWQEDV
jgi:carbonic anhydrase